MTAGEPRLRLRGWRPLHKNSLRGFATVEVLPLGLTIQDIAVNVSHGKPWASLPRKPALDRDGRQVAVDGKKQYATLLVWNDRGMRDRFSAAVVQLVRARHPEAFDGEAS
jgi:hypothetical protein